MIKISETVLNVLSESLRATGIARERGLRLREEGDRLTLELDTPKKGDRIISHKDQRVMIIDPEFEARIGDAFIDVEDTEERPELIMRSSKSQWEAYRLTQNYLLNSFKKWERSKGGDALWHGRWQ